MSLSCLYALFVWISLVYPALGTGFVYRFPGITIQRQRIKSEHSSSTGPPGTGSRRCAHIRGNASCPAGDFPSLLPFVLRMFYSNYVSTVRLTKTLPTCILGTGVSTLFSRQWPAKCTMGQKAQCRECFRAADGPDHVPKLSGCYFFILQSNMHSSF